MGVGVHIHIEGSMLALEVGWVLWKYWTLVVFCCGGKFWKSDRDHFRAGVCNVSKIQVTSPIWVRRPYVKPHVNHWFIKRRVEWSSVIYLERKRKQTRSLCNSYWVLQWSFFRKISSENSSCQRKCLSPLTKNRKKNILVRAWQMRSPPKLRPRFALRLHEWQNTQRVPQGLQPLSPLENSLPLSSLRKLPSTNSCTSASKRALLMQTPNLPTFTTPTPAFTSSLQTPSGGQFCRLKGAFGLGARTGALDICVIVMSTR